jgi:3-vinyl bacteriochlorophyllide hydratase
VLAPVQFLVFAVSLVLVLRYLGTGQGYAAATLSVVLKTLLLYTIMVTGCIWEKVVFGLPVRAGLLLGRRVQHAGAGAAHRLPGGAVHRRAGAAARCCWPWRPTPPT